MIASRATSLRLPRAARHAWLLAVMACVFVFLFTNKAEESECIHNVTIYGTIVLPHNCDALSMADKQLDIRTFYTTYHNWKGRPVYHAYGVLAGNALIPIAVPLWAALHPGARAKDQLPEFGRSFSFHLAYFLLNIGVVIACAWVAIRVSGLEITSRSAVALAAAVASTDLVEGGVWLLHTNIFNLVSAFGTLLFVVLGMQRAILTRSAVLWGGFLIGLGVLVYPALAIIAPGYVAGRLIGRLRVPGGRTPLTGEIMELAMFAAAVALPVLAWWAVNAFIFDTGIYVTADRGQFSWLPQAWAEGKLGPALLRHAVDYFNGVTHVSAAEYLLSLGAIAILTWRHGAGGVRALALDPVVWAVLISMAGVLGFNFLQGYYAPRLHVAAAYLLYVVIARMARTPRAAPLGVVCLFAIAGYQMVNAILTVTVSGN